MPMRVADATMEGLLLQEHNSFWMHGGVASVKDLVAAGDRTGGATLMVPRWTALRWRAAILREQRLRHTARNVMLVMIRGVEQVRLAYQVQRYMYAMTSSKASPSLRIFGSSDRQTDLMLIAS